MQSLLHSVSYHCRPASQDPLELKESRERERLSRQRKKVPALVVKPDSKPKAKVTPSPSVPDPAIAIAAAAALAANKAKADILKAKPCFAFQKGTCDKGKKCTFSHAKAASGTFADAGARTGPYDTSKIPCRFHLKGTCEKCAQC